MNENNRHLAFFYPCKNCSVGVQSCWLLESANSDAYTCEGCRALSRTGTPTMKSVEQMAKDALANPNYTFKYVLHRAGLYK